MELSYYDGIWAYGCIIVSFLIVTLAQVILRVVYAKWKQVDSNQGLTGEMIAKKIKESNIDKVIGDGAPYIFWYINCIFICSCS